MIIGKKKIIFFFFEKQTHTHIRERKMGSNIKAHHNSTKKNDVNDRPR